MKVRVAGMAGAGRSAIPLLGIALFAACAGPGNSPAGREGTPAAPAAPAGGSWVYRCADGTRAAAVFVPDSVRLTVEDREVTLPQQGAASGARYTDGAVTLWIRGTEARLTTASGTREGCSGTHAASVWEASRLMGNDFRGIGQEPGWMVEIAADRRIRLLLDYGVRTIRTSAPTRTVEGSVTTWRAASPEGEVVVRVEQADCADVMSGEEFPARVTAAVGGVRYEGCGRVLNFEF